MASVLGRFWTAATTFFLMPFMLKVMGKDALGVWGLLLRILAFFTLFDIGIGAAITKYSAQYAAERDHEGLNRAINTASAFYLVLGSVGLVACVLLADLYLRFIKTPPELMAAARMSFVWVIAVTVIIVMCTPFRNVLVGLQRLDVINGIEVAMSVPTLIATVWVLIRSATPGAALIAMGVVQFISYTLIYLLITGYAWKLTPGYRFNPRRASWASFLELIGYGTRSTVVSIAYLVQNQVEWLLPARFFGPGLVALYSFGAKPIEVWRNSVTPAFSAITGAASAMSVREPERLRLLYERGAKISNVVLFGVGVWLIVIAPLFITAWMGVGYGAAMLTMRALALAISILLSTGVATAILRGTGKLGPDVLAGLCLAALQIGLGVALGRAFGLRGLLTASVLSFGFAAIVLVYLAHRKMGWPELPLMMRLYVIPFSLAALAAAPLLWLNHLHRGTIVAQGVHRLGVSRLLLAAGAETLAFIGLYLAVVFLTRYVNREELASLRAAIRGVRSVRPVTETPQSEEALGPV